MPREDNLAKAAEGLRNAAIGQESWQSAIGGLADALDSRTGQLIAIGRDALVPLNIMTNMPPEAASEFDAFDGGSPLVNSRVRAGLASPEMQFLDEADFDRADDIMRTPEFGEWIDRYEIGYTAITTLLREKDALVGLAVFRSSSQQAMDQEEKRGFMTLAAHLRAAVVLNQTMEKRTVPLFAAGFESLKIAALVCDLQGNVTLATSSAEQIIGLGTFARLTNGKFIPWRARDRDRFDAAIARALTSRVNVAVRPPAPIALTAADGSKLVVEIVPLSDEAGFTFAAAALVILSLPNQGVGRLAQIAREVYDLTPAETEIVALLLGGSSPQDIAWQRRSTVGTVRNHVHRILSKAGCASQVELLAAVNRFA